MRTLFQEAEIATRFDTSVLIEGETGSGKEVLARSIHSESPRRERPFVPFIASNLPEQLFESELFGHVRGAFSGADSSYEGLARSAVGGTLFIDEIGELTPAAQVKLLRFLDTKEVRQVGSAAVHRIDVRMICATNRNLEQLVAEGQFREDCYYRLKVLRLRVPSLRERPDDIPDLVGYFIDKYNAHHGKRVDGISDAALAALVERPWRGNVRELQNEIERAQIATRDGHPISVEALSSEPFGARLGRLAPVTDLQTVRESAERQVLRNAVEEVNWNVSAAARRLGLSRVGLTRKLKRLGIHRPREEEG